MKKSKVYSCVPGLLLGMFILFLAAPLAVFAQDTTNASEAKGALILDANEEIQAETVTINVKDANISEVLKAYSLQTGQSIVVGPDVVSDNVNVRLNEIPWKDALDVILKPYGFGYRMVGDTIVISRLENIVQVEGIEPLASKVFKLKYLDAYDIKEVCEAQLTSRGKFTILSNKGLPGWEFGGGSSSSRSSSRAVSNIGAAQRKKAEPIEKSKTLIITDVPSSLTAIGSIIEELDLEPDQVLIEAKFIEIDTGVLRDIGVDFATGQNDPLHTAGVQPSSGGNNQWGFTQNESLVEPSAFASLSDNLASAIDYNSGLQLLFSRVAGENFDILLHALEEDGDANILSAPKILTLDNQEAAILVGKKFPIIQSDSTGGSVTGGNVSTSLDYYENIGIQLNVIPQVSNDEYINMIVKPAVSTIDGFESGVVSTGEGGGGALTRYPILNVREAQTQVFLKSGDSAVIGGLQEERDRKSVHKVPFLGDIPYLGVLFKRTTTNKQKIELLIFIKATIVENEAYAVESTQLENEWETRRAGIKAEEEAVEETVVIELSEEEVAEAENVVDPAAEGVVATEQEEMVSFINGSPATEETIESNEM